LAAIPQSFGILLQANLQRRGTVDLGRLSVGRGVVGADNRGGGAR
jgi:hypothetical protein